jgi:hypothetical protein
VCLSERTWLHFFIMSMWLFHYAVSLLGMAAEEFKMHYVLNWNLLADKFSLELSGSETCYQHCYQSSYYYQVSSFRCGWGMWLNLQTWILIHHWEMNSLYFEYLTSLFQLLVFLSPFSRMSVSFLELLPPSRSLRTIHHHLMTSLDTI